MATDMRSNTRRLDHTVLMDEHGGGLDAEFVYARVMALIDEIVMRDVRGFDPEAWRQAVAFFDEIWQQRFPTRRPVQEHRVSATDGAPLALGEA